MTNDEYWYYWYFCCYSFFILCTILNVYYIIIFYHIISYRIVSYRIIQRQWHTSTPSQRIYLTEWQLENWTNAVPLGGYWIWSRIDVRHLVFSLFYLVFMVMGRLVVVDVVMVRMVVLVLVVLWIFIVVFTEWWVAFSVQRHGMIVCSMYHTFNVSYIPYCSRWYCTCYLFRFFCLYRYMDGKYEYTVLWRIFEWMCKVLVRVFTLHLHLHLHLHLSWILDTR